MKKFVLLIATALFALTDAMAFDVRLLANNKEAYSRELSQNDMHDSVIWAKQHKLGADLKARALQALQQTFNEMERIDTNCELGLVARLQLDARNLGIIKNNSEVMDLIVYLRSQDMIDDILFRLLRDSANISSDFLQAGNGIRSSRPMNLYTRQNSGVDLEKIYAPFKKFPDDVTSCAFDALWNLQSNITYKSSKDRDSQLAKLNYMAMSHGVIDTVTFNKIETMRKMKVLEMPIFFKRYADVVNNAKDKLTKNPELKSLNDFSVEYVSRRDKLTQRGNLYRTYDSTQIMMLAQIIEKTAKRMDAKQAHLYWQYTDDPNGEHEIYVLSPMEQYRAAIKMLRKDMAEVMRSDAFRGTGLEYEHLIAAAYEAGFIKSEELDYVLKFEELWNPKQPKWKVYANFAFSLAGTASFYLPPPWNIIGAIGLVLTQSRVINNDQQPDPDDNWNVII